MPEAVIVDAIRTPIGRAFKGSLTQVRPDDLTAYVVDQLLERNPDLDPASVEDLVCGCGMTQGEQAYNIGRIAVLLSEKLPDEVTGSTVARYCASSLNAIRICADAIKAGDGDTYIAAGVESVSRVGPNSEATLPDTQNPKLQGNNGTHNAYISMGETAENVADRFNVSREAMDEYAKVKEGDKPEKIFHDDVADQDVPFPIPVVGEKVKLTGTVHGGSSSKDPNTYGVMEVKTVETIEKVPEKASFPQKKS